MSRVQIVHWKAAESGPLIEACRAGGFDAVHVEGGGMEVCRGIRQNPADAIVIDLTRLPAHGREVAVWLRNTKATRHVPIVFAGGEPEKVAKIREILPDAGFTGVARIATALKKAIRRKPVDPAAPPRMMERAHWKTAAQKLGIVAESTVAAVEPPRDFPALLGVLPGEVDFMEGEDVVAPVTLWFVYDPDSLHASLRTLRMVAGRSKLWIVWRKGSKNGITPASICAAVAEAGLATYRLCAVDDRWSAMAFARKRA